MKRLLVRNHSGQTAVEYILLILVVMVLTMSLMTRVRAFFVPDGRCTPQNRSLICAFERIYDLEDMRYYRFPR